MNKDVWNYKTLKKIDKTLSREKNWCPECECVSKECICPDWHRHYNTKKIKKMKNEFKEREQAGIETLYKVR